MSVSPHKWWLLLLVIAVFGGLSTGLMSVQWANTSAYADDDDDGFNDDDPETLRWDIVFGFVGTIYPQPLLIDGKTVVAETLFDAGGVETALSHDGSWIELSGAGTFKVPSTVGGMHDVTGGGNWATFDPAGLSTGSGTYEVVQLVRYERTNESTVPDPLPIPSFLCVQNGFPSDCFVSPVIDLIGDIADSRGGIAHLKILYFDEIGDFVDEGILVASCGLSANVEGVTATKGTVDYWQYADPDDQDPTISMIFHILDDDDD